MATIPITKRGAEKLKAELHRLKTVDRPAVIAAIAEARAQGDLSENAEYDAAKDRQGFIEGRIQEVEGKLSAAQVIDPSAVNAGGKVVFGATVELEDENTGDAVTYQIVGEDEADLKLGLINVSSPIARALIGKDEGDSVEVKTPGGQKSYEIRLPLAMQVVLASSACVDCAGRESGGERDRAADADHPGNAERAGHQEHGRVVGKDAAIRPCRCRHAGLDAEPEREVISRNL